MKSGLLASKVCSGDGVLDIVESFCSGGRRHWGLVLEHMYTVALRGIL